jgi:hypothetical protein
MLHNSLFFNVFITIISAVYLAMGRAQYVCSLGMLLFRPCSCYVRQHHPRTHFIVGAGGKDPSPLPPLFGVLACKS